MRYLIYALALLVLGAGRPSRLGDVVPLSGATEFPEATITNGVIEAHLYLPDKKTGYYRGARFDWSGVISQLTYKDHTYFGQWFENYRSTLHDAIMGPVDAFDPIGFAEAEPGDSFLKIGIGTMKKPDDKPYHFATEYEILDNGNWKVKKKKDQIEFVHQLNWGEYEYTYTKVVKLERDKPQLTLYHTLKNTGTSVIETNVYNHNFFVIDEQLTGPDFKVTFPFEPSGDLRTPADIGGAEGNGIVYKRVLNKGETLMYAPMTGYGDSASDNQATIENQKTGAGVKIKCDLPISRMVYWSAYKTLCPEPFSKITVKPGKEMSWRNEYEFYVVEKK